MERLEAKNIAFDSQFVIRQNFLDGELIKEFARQADKELVNLYLTKITYREILKHFRMHLVQAKSKNIDNLARKLYVLKHFESYKAYFDLPEIEIERCQNEFKILFDKWIAEHKVKVLEPLLLTADRVLDDYFEMRPPFEESKKSEFPDAFSLEILKKHFENRNRKCYLISGDGGVKKFDSDIILTKLEAKEILELIIKEFDTASPISLIESKFREQEEEVITDMQPLLKNHIKNTILSVYIINGRLIQGIQSLQITVVKNLDLYILSIDGSEFSMIMSSLVIVQSEISLINTSLSTNPDETYTLNPKEKLTIEIRKPTLIDVIIKGNFSLEEAVVKFREYSFSPVDNLIDEV